MKLDGKTVLVTGGTGTIGSRVVRELLHEGCYVHVFSRDQNKQFKMDYDVSSKRVTYFNGDVCDRTLVMRAIMGCDYVIHCAASKHLPLCEKNADSAVKVNVDGTRTVLQCAFESGVRRFLLLSTDKSVLPSSVMGATKFLAERVTLEYNAFFPCSVVRLGNVFASNGSVVPTFLDRIKYQLPLTVNDPSAVRYFMTRKEAGRFIVDRLIDMNGGEIFVKKMKVMTIMALADAMKPAPDYPVKIGKLTQGEKMKELLITQDEAEFASDRGEFIEVSSISHGPKPDASVSFFSESEIKEMLRDL